MNHTSRPAFLTLAIAALAAAATAQLPITNGNLVVVRIGDGVAGLSSAAQATFLDEYTTAGTLVQSIPLPTAPNGANLACTNNGTATSEGLLNLSPDGQWFTLGGYSAAPGTAAINGTTSAAVPRVAARISSATGAVDTSTSMNNAFSAGNIRGVATDNGVQFWCNGSNSGVQYVIYGTSTATALTTGAPTNIRSMGIANGNLYCSSASGAFQGVSQIGTGLPTTATTIALLPGFPTAVGPSNYDFFFADANTVYVADDRATTAGGGIQKWTQSGGTWTLAYTLLPTTASVRYLSGSVSNGVVTLYATSTTSTANAIVSVVDAGVGSPFTTVATAGTNTVLRGVRVAGSHGFIRYSGTGSPTTVGIPTIGNVGGSPTLGNTAFGIRAGNMPAFSIGFVALALGNLLPFGIQVPGAPSTVNIYLNPISTNLVITDATGAATFPIALPSAAGFLGVVLSAQNIAIDFLMPDPLPIGTSVGMEVTLGQ